MKTVWITRILPGARETAERVETLDWKAVVQPLLEGRELAGEVELSGIGALAFTSAAGVRAFAARSEERELPVFAVGTGTARTAREAGFSSVVSAEGDVVALARLIEAARGEIAGEILAPGAAEPAGKLAPARRLALYETRPAPLPEGFEETLDRFDAALLHSPRAARRLAEILRSAKGRPALILCLSPAVAEPLAGLAGLAVAEAPSEEALLRLLHHAV
ncbi:MAG: uroporphyrinogen-III synthase [Caulobacteraceae bacterium]